METGKHSRMTNPHHAEHKLYDRGNCRRHLVDLCQRRDPCEQDDNSRILTMRPRSTPNDT